MTMPIMPGPFSFLASAGEAAGRIGQEKERVRTTRRREAQEKANQMLALRAAGLMSPADFNRPEVQQVFNEAGLNAPSTQPTSAEQAEFTRREFAAGDMPEFAIPLDKFIPGMSPGSAVNMPARGPSSISDERRMVAGLPKRSDVAKEQRQARTFETGTELQKDHLANIPDATTLQASTDAARDQLYNALASRAVDAAITRTGGVLAPATIAPIVEQAWLTAQEDAKMRGYTAREEITKPYIEAQIASKLRQQEEMRLRGLPRPSSGGDNDPIKFLRDQLNNVRQQIQMVKAPDTIIQMAANGFKAKLAQASPEERQQLMTDPRFAFARQAVDEVASYEETIQMLTNEMQGYRDALQNAISGRSPDIPGATPGRETRQFDEGRIDAIVRRMREQNIPVSQIDQDVQNGLITAADGAAIKQRLQAGAAVTTGGHRDFPARRP